MMDDCNVSIFTKTYLRIEADIEGTIPSKLATNNVLVTLHRKFASCDIALNFDNREE